MTWTIWLGPLAALIALALTVVWLRLGILHYVGLFSWGLLVGVVLTLLVTGCSATATYTAPTGQQATCYRPANYPGSGLLGLLTSPLYAKAEYDAATDYAACKTALEAAGWSRQP